MMAQDKRSTNFHIKEKVLLKLEARILGSFGESFRLSLNHEHD
jgi:hypothetical protein